MNEKKKSLILLFMLAVLLVIIITVVIMSLIESTKKIEEIKNIMDSSEPQIIYLSKPTCYYCNLIEPITSSLEKEFELDYFNINTGELSKLELTKVLETIGINVNTFGTPYIAIVQNGKIIGEQVGYTDENVLFELFKKHGLIKENVSLNINYIDDLNTILNETSSKLVLIGSSGDAASIEARIILRSLAKEYDVEVNYFDTSKLETEDEYNELLDKLAVKKLPVLANVENGQFVSTTVDVSSDEYKTFLQKNNYIN